MFKGSIVSTYVLVYGCVVHGLTYVMVNVQYPQIELDKTAEEFRSAHRDRQDLIKNWEQTIEQMRRRDQDMDRCATVSE